MAAVKLARQAGATVIAVAAKPERIRRIIAFGANYGIDYETQNVVEKVKELTAGKGVDLVLDMSGGKLLLEACAYRGRYCMIGGAGANYEPFEFMELVLNSLTLFSILFGKEMSSEAAHHFPLSDAASAHLYVENNRPIGRVLLDAKS